MYEPCEVGVKKIPTVFVRDFAEDPSRVLPEYHEDCQWVADGEGVATRKLDGTCCMARGGVLYKRREVKAGRPEPYGFELVEEDPKTGKRVGWVEVGNGSEDKWYREAMLVDFGRSTVVPDDGTYELVGPKVQGNPESLLLHELVSHQDPALEFEDGEPLRDFHGLEGWMAGKDIEGIVWHHQDGRMAKLKLRDFGIKRAA